MQDYNTIIGAIQMRLNKCPTRSVMDRFQIGSSTLNLIMSRYKALELTIDELEAMSPKKVENLFYPQKNLQRKEVPLPDFQYYYDRIHAPNNRVNISFCWLDYKEKNPDGYEKSQFYEYYQRFVQENYGGTKISMAVNRKPGEKMYNDWVGDQPGLLTDVTTGEIMRVHIFATTLGVSSMIYAEAFPNEKLPCFIEGCAHAASFYGAVAKHFVPDNLKTAVTKHTKDDLVLQSTFSDLEDFYDTIVLPPSARKPKGKPTVKNHVRYLETHLIEKLKEMIEEDLPFEEIVEKGQDYLNHSRLFFALKSLHNFAMNGRVSKAVASAIGVLNISIFATASEEGTIQQISKCRGEKKVVKSMIEHLENAGYHGGKVRISHADNLKLAHNVRDKILELYPNADIIVYPMGGLCTYYAEIGGLLVGCEC